jgi:site-specific DNA-methyltransferase (adenine-specific)/modification methylase
MVIYKCTEINWFISICNCCFSKIENKNPKVIFKNLIEKGYVKIDEKLYSEKKDKEIVVQADVSIESGNEIGNIHKVSAKMLNKESNNGWDFFCMF